MHELTKMLKSIPRQMLGHYVNNLIVSENVVDVNFFLLIVIFCVNVFGML